MHFMTHASNSTINGYIEIIVLLMVSSKNTVLKCYFWEGQQHAPQYTCSWQIKNILLKILNEYS
jgi:hypothetical protein